MNTILSLMLNQTSAFHQWLYVFVQTKAYPYIPAAMFSENLNSTLTG